jgi:protein gp37
MANETGIEWCDFSSNPLKYRDAAGKTVWACVKCSSGCANCYSEAIAQRFERGGPYTKAVTEKVTPFLDDKELLTLLKSKKLAGKRVFLGDMTDVFGEWVPDELLDQLFCVLALRRDVTFQLLTKRAERMSAYWNTPNRRQSIAAHSMALSNGLAARAKSHAGRLTMAEFEAAFMLPGPFGNLWLGCSVENQAAADERIPHLLRTPAAVRFLSCEPLLGPVDLEAWLWASGSSTAGPWKYPSGRTEPGRGVGGQMMSRKPARELHWCIIGGESGPGARPMQLEWARALVAQCKTAGVACFVKQLGADPVSLLSLPLVRPDGERLRDKKGGDPEEWPSDLRVREFPNAEAA